MLITVQQRNKDCIKANLFVGDKLNVKNPGCESPFMIIQLISQGWFKWPELVINLYSDKERLIG